MPKRWEGTGIKPTPIELRALLNKLQKSDLMVGDNFKVVKDEDFKASPVEIEKHYIRPVDFGAFQTIDGGGQSRGVSTNA